MINSTGDRSNYQPNGEFVLEGFVPRRHAVYYSCCKEPYIDITYSIVMRRRPMFYVFNLILPCILINGIGNYAFLRRLFMSSCGVIFYQSGLVPVAF
jgi:nicotinic acetylcholine receptor